MDSITKTKICNKCGKEKDINLFYFAGKKNKDGTASRVARCKECQSVYRRGYYLAVSKSRELSSNSAWRKRNLVRKRDLGREQYKRDRFASVLSSMKYEARRNGHAPCNATKQQLIESYTGFCKSCGRPEGKRKLHADHNHETGEFRGFLCGQCNQALGLLEDSELKIQQLLDYKQAEWVK